MVRRLLGLRSMARQLMTGFAGLDVQEAGDTRAMWHGIGFAYRLRAWPALRWADKTAPIYRALSVMSTRPVSVAWFAKRSGISTHRAQEIVDWLMVHDYAEAIALDKPQGARR